MIGTVRNQVATLAVAAAAVLGLSSQAHATQETFTSAGPLNCSAVAYCEQKTTDGLFKLIFVPTYPTSAPSSTGFNVNEPMIEVYNASGALLDLNILQATLTGSEFYNGVNFLGAIEVEAQDAAGNWNYVGQYSTLIGSNKGVYVMFSGKTASAPLVRNVQGIRISGINGATAFRIGMLNLTAH